MPSPRLTTYALAAGTAWLAAAALPGAASAKVLPADINALPRGAAINEGTATLTLSNGPATKLAAAGVKLTGTGGAKAKGKTLTFAATPEKSVVDPTTMQGLALLKGGLTVKGAKKTAKLSAITLEPGIEKRVTAKLGGKLVELGSLKGGTDTFTRPSTGSLKGAKLALSAGGAKKLNTATGGGFAKGTFATLALKLVARELPLASGTATMTMDPALLKTLADGGYGLTAEAPATINGAVVTLPLVAGAFDPIRKTGRLQIEGNVTVGKPDLGVTLFAWRAAIGNGQNDLYANFNTGAAAPLATIDVAGLNATINGTAFTSSGAKLGLSKIAVDVLKQQFGVVMPVGTPMGTVDINGTLSS